LCTRQGEFQINLSTGFRHEFTAAYWTQQEKCMNQATSKANNSFPNSDGKEVMMYLELLPLFSSFIT
jgi:hypothetical protein